MKFLREFITNTVIGGLLIILPTYLAILLLLKLLKTVREFMRPMEAMLPKWIHAELIMSVLALLVASFVIGLLLRTRAGRALRESLENKVLGKLPGYKLFRSLTSQLTSKTGEKSWKPCLAEIEEALVPAFIIEEHEDGKYTVFVPSVPTPFAGAVYILTSQRVHPVDVSFIHAMKAVSQWGAGAKDLLAAMKT